MGILQSRRNSTADLLSTVLIWHVQTWERQRWAAVSSAFTAVNGSFKSFFFFYSLRSDVTKCYHPCSVCLNPLQSFQIVTCCQFIPRKTQESNVVRTSGSSNLPFTSVQLGESRHGGTGCGGGEEGPAKIRPCLFRAHLLNYPKPMRSKFPSIQQVSKWEVKPPRPLKMFRSPRVLPRVFPLLFSEVDIVVRRKTHRHTWPFSFKITSKFTFRSLL